MEEDAELPTQLRMHLVVMLPKNSEIERPIALTSVLWRVWCRLRKPLLDDWQRSLPADMDHDRARPGACVLHVALERLLRQKVHRARHKSGLTVLMDMSTFYDTTSSTSSKKKQSSWPILHCSWNLQCSCTRAPKQCPRSKR